MHACILDGGFDGEPSIGGRDDAIGGDERVSWLSFSIAGFVQLVRHHVVGTCIGCNAQELVFRVFLSQEHAHLSLLGEQEEDAARFGHFATCLAHRRSHGRSSAVDVVGERFHHHSHAAMAVRFVRDFLEVRLVAFRRTCDVALHQLLGNAECTCFSQHVRQLLVAGSVRTASFHCGDDLLANSTVKLGAECVFFPFSRGNLRRPPSHRRRNRPAKRPASSRAHACAAPLHQAMQQHPSPRAARDANALALLASGRRRRRMGQTHIQFGPHTRGFHS
mmetsp:Transcript_3988/g.25115  ORF Transcript_3988/g.25115 Transcript_3988/m.25115 type:complete len:277 (+) Transcript_3988:1352-2182(+)